MYAYIQYDMICMALKERQSPSKFSMFSMTDPVLFALILAAILGLHSGHADQPGEHDPGEDSLYVTHVRGHGAWPHRDGRQRAPGFPSEESPRPPADCLGWSVQTAQERSIEGEEGDTRTKTDSSQTFFSFLFPREIKYLLLCNNPKLCSYSELPVDSIMIFNEPVRLLKHIQTQQ